MNNKFIVAFVVLLVFLYAIEVYDPVDVRDVSAFKKARMRKEMRASFILEFLGGFVTGLVIHSGNIAQALEMGISFSVVRTLLLPVKIHVKDVIP